MGLPIGIFGLGFFVAFLLLQKARVVFYIGSEATQTVNGSFAEVADLVAAVQVSRRNLINTGTEALVIPGFFRSRQSVGQWLTRPQDSYQRPVTSIRPQVIFVG